MSLYILHIHCFSYTRLFSQLLFFFCFGLFLKHPFLIHQFHIVYPLTFFPNLKFAAELPPLCRKTHPSSGPDRMCTDRRTIVTLRKLCNRSSVRSLDPSFVPSSWFLFSFFLDLPTPGARLSHATTFSHSGVTAPTPLLSPLPFLHRSRLNIISGVSASLPEPACDRQRRPDSPSF